MHLGAYGRGIFPGGPEVLRSIRNTVSIPLLRKDFIIDELQIYEARVLGADAILLIAAILEPEQIASYHRTARELGMDVLVEVHDRQELETVLEVDGATLIGVNNRDLRTFETRLETTEQLAALVPDDVTLISESGIAGPQDVEFLRGTGAQGILVGEYFMRQQDIGRAVLELMEGKLQQ